MKYRIKDNVGIVRHDGKDYGPGDRIELTKEQAELLADKLVGGEEFAPPKPKLKPIDAVEE